MEDPWPQGLEPYQSKRFYMLPHHYVYVLNLHDSLSALRERKSSVEMSVDQIDKVLLLSSLGSKNRNRIILNN